LKNNYQQKWIAVLQLMRPANIITAIADIIAGISIAGFLNPVLWTNDVLFNIILLISSTIGLYGGGIVFNDVFDYKQDKINRPERVLPSGRISLRQAKIVGSQLFFIGVFSAFLVSIYTGLVAIGVMLMALLYDKIGKHNKVLGPINMGLCRGGNLILGMSISVGLASDFLLIGIVPVIFISAITLTAQKEAKGKNKLAIGLAMLLDISIVGAFFLMYEFLSLSWKNAGYFLLLWYGINVYAKAKAIYSNEPKMIMKAVKFGILSLIPLNATYVAGFSSVNFALLLLCLLPISLFLAKKFPVT
jgi:4-hydroxybenzoate polyprenyltransferase